MQTTTQSEPCWLCGAPAPGAEIPIRGGKTSIIHRCGGCRFEFFMRDPHDAMSSDLLDKTRLQAAGLDIPSIEADFANGKRQCRDYIGRFLTADDKGSNICEIGCSWGYFLDLVRDFGGSPVGLELNRIRARYVSETLEMPCFTELEALEADGRRYRKFFLFYVLEYVLDPRGYISRLLNLLEPGGEIVIITPNLRDPLKDLWQSKAFGEFFYEECSIAYFSPDAAARLIEPLRPLLRSAEVRTEQGYSIVNHLSWHLTGKPRTTGIVGGDRFIEDIAAQLRSAPHGLGARLAGLVEDFDRGYRAAIEEERYGNRILIRLVKGTPG